MPSTPSSSSYRYRAPSVAHPTTTRTAARRSTNPLVPTAAALRRHPLPPPTPLPMHPTAERPTAKTHLTTPATAFALQSYLTTFLLHLGWEPTLTPAPQFITTYSWLLGQELSLPPEMAAKLFLEIWECCTPTIGMVATAIRGMEETLGCAPEVKRGVERLWRRNQGCGVEEALGNWGEDELEVKVAVGVVGRRGRRVGGWWSVWREVVRRVFTKEEKGEKK